MKENGNPAPNEYYADKIMMGKIYNSKFRSGHFITMSKRLKKCGYKTYDNDRVIDTLAMARK